MRPRAINGRKFRLSQPSLSHFPAATAARREAWFFIKGILTGLTPTITLVVMCIAVRAQTPDQVAAESKRANEFYDKCWAENLARHPVDESFYGIKTHYDQLEDLSDEKAAADHAVWQRQLETLKREFKPDLLDAQARLSYRLFEREAEREAEDFKFRFDVYPVSQMRGVHAQIPTFLINIHKIDDVNDAEAVHRAIECDPEIVRSTHRQFTGS